MEIFIWIEVGWKLYSQYEKKFRHDNWHLTAQRYVEHKHNVGYRETNEIFIAI